MYRPDDAPDPLLLDRFGRRVTYLRVSVTDRCNFRCVYCMPAEGDPFLHNPELLTFDEIQALVEVFVSRGLRKVRITGGEPLVRAGVPELVARLRGVEGIEVVALTTNAFLLDRQAAPLAEAGLSAVNISLDSLRPERFRELTRHGDLSRVIAGLDAAIEAGIPTIKLNAVVIRGFNDDEVCELVEFAADRGVALRFIEFMPIGQRTRWGTSGATSCVPAQELRAVLSSRWQITPIDPALPAHQRLGGPARAMHLSGPGLPDAGARVGIISAVTEHFCSTCNRLRISARGGLRACLADDREADLRGILRDPALDPAARHEHLARAIAAALDGKRERHTFDLNAPGVTSTPMNAIGG